VQDKEADRLNFRPRCARSSARPNIISVGEIRDFKTAEIGVKRAHGHLVLSTAAYQRRAFDHQPLNEHGYRTISRGHIVNPLRPVL